jgi:hypothetical protein
MGIETCAITENRLAGDKLSTLAEQLTANSQLATCMREFDIALRTECPQLREQLHAEAWRFHKIEEWKVEGGWDAGCKGQCDGPFGTLYLYDNFAQLSWYWCRWHIFLEHAQIRNPLYEATRIISSMLNAGAASTAVFVPDSSYDASLTLDELHRTMPEVLSFLSEKCGPPAGSLESIVQEPAKGYYVTRWPASGVSI